MMTLSATLLEDFERFAATFVVDHLTTIIHVLFLLCIGMPLVWMLSRIIGTYLKQRTSEQTGMIIRKVVQYAGVILILVTVIYQLGFEITPLLGAAGIAGIAIAFAAQTSVSNIISGVFLVAEKPFAVGDVVRVGDTTGTVLSIDLLSLKLRTFDNQFVRIPNEVMMKTQVVNITRFPIRRVDTTVSVAYREDMDRVRDVLLDLARRNPHVLDEPEPIVMLTQYADSGINFLFAVWCVKADFMEIRKTLIPDIKKRLDEEGIEIPFPHMSLYAGSKTDPLPIKLVNSDLPLAVDAPHGADLDPD